MNSLLLNSVRSWLDRFPIERRGLAKVICHLIPAQCPFERDIYWFGRRIAHIPPMCQINPFYEQFVGLRFRALSFLADRCGEDISQFFTQKIG